MGRTRPRLQLADLSTKPDYAHYYALSGTNHAIHCSVAITLVFHPLHLINVLSELLALRIIITTQVFSLKPV